MAAPLSVPSGAVPVWPWNASLRFFRRLLGIPKEQPAPASAARAPARLGVFDWDGPDTSLTQAQLEVLK